MLIIIFIQNCFFKIKYESNYFGESQLTDDKPCHAVIMYPMHVLTYCPSRLSPIETTALNSVLATG